MRKLLGALLPFVVSCSSHQPAPRVADATSPARPAATARAARFEDCVEPSQIQQALTARNMAFQDCYADGLARDPELRGTVTLGVFIQPSGEGRVHIQSSTLGNEAVNRCIVEVASGLEFEQDSCSVAQTLEYPVRLARGSSEFASMH